MKYWFDFERDHAEIRDMKLEHLNRNLVNNQPMRKNNPGSCVICNDTYEVTSDVINPRKPSGWGKILGRVLDVWICRVHVPKAMDVIPRGQTITQPMTTEPPRTWSVRTEQEQCNMLPMATSAHTQLSCWYIVHSAVPATAAHWDCEGQIKGLLWSVLLRGTSVPTFSVQTLRDLTAFAYYYQLFGEEKAKCL